MSLALLARRRARAGDRPGALAVVAELEEASKTRYMPGFALAVAYAGLGDHDKAFAALERAYEERFNRLAYLRMDPLVADLSGRSQVRRSAAADRLAHVSGQVSWCPWNLSARVG